MKFLIVLILILLSTSLWAASGSVPKGLIITPIAGFEKVQKFVPTPSMKTRMIYGARLVFPLPIGALEAEYTHGQDDSTDLSTTPNTFYKDSEDKVKLGLRGSASLGNYFSTYLRGGAQGRQNKQTKTVNNVSTTSTTQSKVQPYIGTGIAIHLLQYFSLNADITATYTPTTTPNLKNYEFSPSLGISAGF